MINHYSCCDYVMIVKGTDEIEVRIMITAIHHLGMDT